MKNKVINRLNVFLIITYTVGLAIFWFYSDVTFLSANKWVLGYSLIGSSLLLMYFKILLTTNNNALSLDSTIYLACLYIFGLELTLIILLFSSIIFSLFDRKTPWRAHLFNYTVYNIMLFCTYSIFIYLGGIIGYIDFNALGAYIIALAAYFIINILFVASYSYFAGKASLIDAIKGFINGTLESYAILLLLSLVLGVLLQNQIYVGLSLFVLVSLLLSFSFKQQYNLFQSVKNKANKDQLTGLYNHGYFKEILNEKFDEMKQVTNNTPLSLAMLDIDDFKIFNDSNGHMKGDQVLTLFGEILLEKCREKDYVVARYGGEEFVILMPETNEKQANDFIEYIRKEINNTYVDGVERLPYGCLSFSAGIIEWTIEMYNPTEFLTHADQAMYYAKEQGKNNTHIYGNEFEPLEITASIEELEQQLKLLLAKDIYTYRHSKRVFKFAVEFGKYLLLNEQDKKLLTLGALVHDIGKLEVPRDIINKTGKLTAEEWNAVKQHVTWGKEIIEVDKKNASLVPLVELHHERFDGKGYPYGKKAEEIPKLARILCVIDSFDAMTTERPYQKTKSYKDGLEELRNCSGTQFDPFYAEAFIDYFKKEYIQDEEDIIR